MVKKENNDDSIFKYIKNITAEDGTSLYYKVPIKKLNEYSYMKLFYGWKGNKKYEEPYFEYLDLDDSSKTKQYDFCINDVLLVYSFLRQNAHPIIISNKLTEIKIKKIIINKTIEACKKYKINKNACYSLSNKMNLI